MPGFARRRLSELGWNTGNPTGLHALDGTILPGRGSGDNPTNAVAR